MVNSVFEAMLGYGAIFNALPYPIKAFISFTLLSFITVIAFRLIWRIKG